MLGVPRTLENRTGYPALLSLAAKLLNLGSAPRDRFDLLSLAQNPSGAITTTHIFVAWPESIDAQVSLVGSSSWPRYS